MDSSTADILKISFAQDLSVSIVVSAWFWIVFLALVAGVVILRLFIGNSFVRHLDLVSVDIKLGNVGKASFKPNFEDIQIAHKVWTELITRKAALPIDEENDVILEVYDSWYILFGKVRELIASIPAHYIHNEKSTKELVRIATGTLNHGLRPHLTLWQAKFRNWHKSNEDKFPDLSPQQLQRKFPEYELLIADLKSVNKEMVQYASELKKIAHGT